MKIGAIIKNKSTWYLITTFGNVRGKFQTLREARHAAISKYNLKHIYKKFAGKYIVCSKKLSIKELENIAFI